MKSQLTGDHNLFAHKRHELYRGRPEGQAKHHDKRAESPAVRKLRERMGKVRA